MKNTFYMFICILLLSNGISSSVYADANRGDVHFRSLQLDVPQAVTSGGIGNSAGDISALTASVGGSISRSLAARFGETVNAADYGVVCDYNATSHAGTDNTAALASAISAAQSNAQFGGRKLVLPPGACLTGPQTISGQIVIEGQGMFASQLVLKSGATTPLLTFANAYSPDFTGASDAYTFGRNFSLTSVDGYSAWNAGNDASGMKIHPTGSTWFYFENIEITNMPNNGIEVLSSSNMVNLINPTLSWNGAWGLSSNSTNDMAVIGAQIYFNGKGANSPSLPAKGGGWLSSGDGALYISNINSFYNNGPGAWFYAPTHITNSGHNEYNGNVAQGIIVSSGTSLLTQMTMDGVILSLNSRLSPGTYPDLEYVSGSGTVILNGALLGKNYAAGGGSSGYNVKIDSGATPNIACVNCFFGAGSIGAAGVTNDPVHFTAFGANGGALNGPVAVVSGAQYSGQTWGNGANIFAKIMGGSSANDVGLLQLSSGGTPGVSLSAGGGIGSYIMTNTGFGGNTSPAYPVDVNGDIHATGVGRFTSLALTNATQFGGQSWGNGIKNFAIIGGSTLNNDSGYFVLQTGGETKVSLSAGNGVANYFSPNVGFGGQTSPAYPVDVTGAVHASTYIAGGGGLYSVVNSWTGVPVGARSYITDAVSCSSRLSAVLGGGALFCPVVFNGSWLQD